MNTATGNVPNSSARALIIEAFQRWHIEDVMPQRLYPRRKIKRTYRLFMAAGAIYHIISAFALARYRGFLKR
jgi:hypothetical protein